MEKLTWNKFCCSMNILSIDRMNSFDEESVSIDFFSRLLHFQWDKVDNITNHSCLPRAHILFILHILSILVLFNSRCIKLLNEVLFSLSFVSTSYLCLVDDRICEVQKNIFFENKMWWKTRMNVYEISWIVLMASVRKKPNADIYVWILSKSTFSKNRIVPILVDDNAARGV